MVLDALDRGQSLEEIKAERERIAREAAARDAVVSQVLGPRGETCATHAHYIGENLHCTRCAKSMQHVIADGEAYIHMGEQHDHSEWRL